MELARFFRHVWMSPIIAARCFPAAAMDAIQAAIAASESRHRGEVCFVVEAELTTAQLWACVSSRDRAREVFALQGVWNTEENNGVLVYLLLADRRVEIVADRGVDRVAGSGEWERICRMMEGHFREGRYPEGAVAGVEAVSLLLERYFPGRGDARNEVPDRPIAI
ncbi:MAG TPA: TPM domain-containing protein [Usitatibacter sp.]|nr:TPM domain-containing protein [Usitatibacter sp.]